MATIKKGILGGFSGRIGTVVGSSIFGIDVMRSYQPDVRNPQSVGQNTQRNKFSLVVAWLLPLILAIRTGFSIAADKMSPWNAAISYNIKNAIAGTYPNQSITKADVLISKGSLAPLADFSCCANADSTLNMGDQSLEANPTLNPNDKLYLVFWHFDEYWVCIPNAATRLQMKNGDYDPINIGTYTEDHEVRAYAFFVSPDGSSVSNSDYNPGEGIG